MKNLFFKILFMSILIEIFTACFTPKVVESCFTQANYEQTLKYCKWKLQTAKTVRVTISGGYELKIGDNQDILFQERGYSIARISKDEGIVLLPVKQSKKLENKVNTAFCDLVKTATIWGTRYNEHFKE